MQLNNKSIAPLLTVFSGQERFVTKEDWRLTVVEELSTLVTVIIQWATRLRQSILQLSFEWKLANKSDGREV